MQTLVMNRSVFGVSGKYCLVIAGLLGTLVLYILAWAYPTFPGDEGVLVQVQALRTGWLDETAVAFDNLGLFWVFVPLTVVLIQFLMLARRYADVAMVVGGGLMIGLGHGLKMLVDRPRPDYQLVGTMHSGLSFPSGHTLLAVIMGGLLVYLIGLWVKPLILRRAIQVGIITAVVVMGASRVYLGAHWPSDVIGSYMLGVMALVGLIGLRNAVAPAR